jgi:DNA primase
MTAVDEIKSRLDIVEIVSETVKLRRTGKNYIGFCPFHANTRTPAFVVFPDSGTWRCFGQCNEGGDIFGYVMKKEGWDFPETLRRLAERAGVVLEPQTPAKQAAEEANERLVGLLEEAVNFYRHHLLQTPAGRPALEYLHKRGIKPETIEAFGLGYAPDSWDSCLRYFTAKNYTPEDLLRAGLATERQGGEGVYDRFRNRILFPIRNVTGHMTGFGARILNPEDMPKFLNSPQTELFDKGRLLYGLDVARKAIRAQDQVVIVEGYLDVILVHQAGYTNVVSPMGTALTEEQLRLLKRFTRRIVLALDADAAGEKATLRGLEVARQAMDHADVLAFDARGLLRHEARLQADLRVTTLPPGMDPDEVVLRDPAEWGRLVESAKPIVMHVMDTLAAAANLDDPKAKAEVAGQVLPLIEDIPNPVERDAYRQALARLLRVDERALTGLRPPPARPPRRQVVGMAPSTQPAKPRALPAGPDQLALSLERHCLSLLVRQPEARWSLDRRLQEAGLTCLGVEDFEQSDHQALTRLVLASLDQDELDAPHFIQEQIPEALRPLFEDLLKPLARGEPNSERLLEDLTRSIMRLRQLRLNEGLNQLRHLQQEQQENVDLQEQGELKNSDYQELVLQYTRLRDRLDRALRQPGGR